MMLLKLIFLFISVNSGRISYNRISTKFTKKSDMINYLTKPKFYFKYLDIIEAKDPKFSPKLSEQDSEVVFPLEITYYAVPKFNLIPSRLTQIKVHQKWNRENDIFCGHVKTKYIEFDITIQPILEHKNYMLNFKGEIVRKSILIPEKYLDSILQDFGGIFMQISNC